MNTLMTAMTAHQAVRPHPTGVLARDLAGDMCLSTSRNADIDGVTYLITGLPAVAIDAAEARQWSNTPKFGHAYHFQRWRFAP